MNSWIFGVSTSLVGGAIWLVLVWIVREQLFPRIRANTLSVPNINQTEWESYSPDSPNPEVPHGKFTINQSGTKIKGFAYRKTRNGERKFRYDGVFLSGQLVLQFEEPEGKGYIVGSMVLFLSSRRDRLKGRSTYYHFDKGEVISTPIEFRLIK